jgi:hypothetical protein
MSKVKLVKLQKLLLGVAMLTIVAATPARADDLRCLNGWTVDGNGYFGTLNLSIVQGQVTGTIYGDPIQGFYNNVSNELMFIRSNAGSTDPSFQQVWTGYYWQEPSTDVIAGSYEGFLASGASAGRHRWAFYANCYIIP